MPGKAAHLRQSADNETFMAAIAGTSSQWEAVVAFYAAVHWVEALASSNGCNFSSHYDRNQYVLKDMGVLYAKYIALYQLSRRARYECYQVTATELTKAQNALAEIRRYVQAHCK